MISYPTFSYFKVSSLIGVFIFVAKSRTLAGTLIAVVSLLVEVGLICYFTVVVSRIETAALTTSLRFKAQWVR